MTVRPTALHSLWLQVVELELSMRALERVLGTPSLAAGRGPSSSPAADWLVAYS